MSSVLTLSVTDIHIGDRVGFFSSSAAEALGALIAVEGQHTPILVRRNGNASKVGKWTLIDGLHRLRGSEAVGRSTVLAIEAAPASSEPLDLLEMEVSANLHRREMRPIELSRFVRSFVDCVEARQHPDHLGERPCARAIRLRWEKHRDPADVSLEKISQIESLSTFASQCGRIGWKEESSASLGFSVRKIEQLLTIYGGIAKAFPNEAQALNDHPLGSHISHLERFATRSEDDRRKVIDRLLSDAKFATWDAAYVAAGVAPSKGARADGDGKFVVNFFSNWSRMNLAQRRTATRQLVSEWTPGMRAEVRKLLDEADA